MYQEEILKYEIDKVPESVRKFTDEEKLRNILKEQIGNGFKLISNEERAKEFMNLVKHSNKNILDYNAHLINLEENKFILSYINFRSINPINTPFVEIAYKNFDIINYKDLKKMLNIIFEKYERFNPEYISFFEISGKKEPENFERVDNFVIGHINTIKNLPKPEKYDEIKIEKVNDLSFYDKYFEEYKRLKEENKMFETERIESEKSFENCMAAGAVFKIIIKDEFAGVYALRKMNMNFLFGFYVIEQVLFKKFRRQNFASAVQRKAIDDIAAEEDNFIYGTIYTTNKASLKTAMKCGRYIAGSYFQVKF